MKVLKIVLVSLAGLVVLLCLAAVIFIKTFDVNRYKPQIIAEAKKVLSRQVDFQKANLGISLSQGISLKISGFSISEDPLFGSGQFLKVGDISVGVDLVGYLTRKKISVTGILIDAPQVTLIRLKDGSINAQTFATPAQAGKEVVQSAPAAAAIAVPTVLVSSIKISNGTVVYIDNSFNPAFRLELKAISASVANISLKPGSGGQIDLSADLELNEATLNLRELALPVRNIKAKAKVRGNKITLEQAFLSAGEGSVNASGALDDYLSRQEYNFSSEAKELKLQELISQDKFPVKFEGITSAKLTLKGAGFTPEALKTSLSGNSDISIVKAKLVGMNVLSAVLDKISILPGLSQRIEAGLPDKYKQKLAQKDTVLSDIKLPVVIKNGRFMIDDLSIGADEFIFKGSGQAGISGTYSLEGSFLIPQDLSAAMVSQVSELKYLLNGENQIFIPLKVSGKGGDLKLNVDGQYIVSKLAQNQLKQQLFKALGVSGPSGAASQEENSNAGQNNPDSSAKDAVGSLLHGIFK